MQKNNKMITLLAIIIIAFGTIGCVPCFAGLYFVKNLELKTADTSQVINTLNSSIDSITILVEDSSLALSNVAGTVEDAKDSLSEASVMLEDSSEAMMEISKLVNFDILGIKPLEGVSVYFESIATDLGDLSENILMTSVSVGKNIEDINKVSDDLGAISIKMDTFSTSFTSTADTIPIFGLKTVMYIALLYFGMLNIIFILIGVSLAVLSRKANK